MLLTFVGAIPREEEVDNDGGGGDGLATWDIMAEKNLYTHVCVCAEDQLFITLIDF